MRFPSLRRSQVPIEHEENIAARYSEMIREICEAYPKFDRYIRNRYPELHRQILGTHGAMAMRGTGYDAHDESAGKERLEWMVALGFTHAQAQKYTRLIESHRK